MERQKVLPITYDGHQIESAFRVDLLVEDRVVAEVKAVAALKPIHLAQLLTYLRLSGTEVGLLINFNARTLKEGIRRVIANPPT